MYRNYIHDSMLVFINHTKEFQNGSRILTAHLEIGFHPLVITSSDRVYSIQCIDNSYVAVRNRQLNVAGYQNFFFNRTL